MSRIVQSANQEQKRMEDAIIWPARLANINGAGSVVAPTIVAITSGGTLSGVEILNIVITQTLQPY